MNRPDWLDPELYPFESRWRGTPHGRMHYVDEGEGPPVVLVHGTPTWSFLFRDVIRELSTDHRVVAPDHLGFGLSDKPADAPYRPRDHAQRLTGLMDELGLEDVTLVVHDFGGPIGLSWALERPEAVRALVVMNTWMWSLEGTAAARAGRLFGTWVGRLLYTRLNFSPRVLLPTAYADKARLTPEIHRHYLAPFPNARSRKAPWAFARALADSGPWFGGLWERRERLSEIPLLVVWGMEDSLLGTGMLGRWKEAFRPRRVEELQDVGHFVSEEAEAGALSGMIREHARAG